MDPGAVLLALLGSANLASRHAVFDQYDSTVGADTVAGPGRGAAVLRVKGTTKALVATTDGNQAVGALDPWLGAALSGRRGDPQRVDHRRPAARRDELPQLRRPDPARGVLAAHRGRPRPRRRVPGARPARSPAATSRSTTSRRPGPIAPTAEIGVVGLLDDVDDARRPGLRPRPRRGPARRRDGPGPGRLGLRGARRAARARTTRRPSTSPARPRSRPSSARRSPAASSPRPRTSRAAASPSPSPSARCGAGSGRRSASRSRTRRRSTCSARARRGSS